MSADQRAAMEWTNKHIASFGGDPSKVFIVGQSAGANSVSQHLVRPKSWPYFSSAGMESGAFYDGIDTATVASQKPTWEKLAEHLNCSKKVPRVSDAECIVTADTLALVEANMMCCGGWSITVDDVDLTAPGPVLAKQGKLAKVPIITGSVREDIGSWYSSILDKPGSHPPPASKCPPLTGKGKGLQCTEDDFRSFGASMGLDPHDLEQFVEAYQGDENGHPPQSKMDAGCQHPVLRAADVQGVDANATSTQVRIHPIQPDVDDSFLVRGRLSMWAVRIVCSSNQFCHRSHCPCRRLRCLMVPHSSRRARMKMKVRPRARRARRAMQATGTGR